MTAARAAPIVPKQGRATSASVGIEVYTGVGSGASITLFQECKNQLHKMITRRSMKREGKSALFNFQG